MKELYSIYLEHPSICTDSRKLQKGDLFFALKGDHFNGNGFAGKAISNGAAYSIIDEPSDESSKKCILVKDVLSTLQELAGHHRNQFSIPFIAITGSNGKTTTKELIHAVVSGSYKTYTTEGNFNNHIGIPLTLLKIKKDAEIAVVEMGANHLKEIEGYCKYTRPTHGLITNAGKAHLEGFGSPEGVKKGKGELYDYLRANNGTAFVLWDYEYLQQMSKGIQDIITYGTREASLTGVIKESQPFLSVQITGGLDLTEIHTRLAGDYNLPNVLAAVAVGKHFNTAPEKIKAAIENYQPSNSRSQWVTIGSNHIILDAYNANPSSMRAAIENIASFSGQNKVLVLGAMAELGKDSLSEHQQIIHLIDQHKWKAVALVGGDFLKIKHPYFSFPHAAEARQWLQGKNFENCTILVKGSRSMKMETVLANAD